MQRFRLKKTLKSAWRAAIHHTVWLCCFHKESFVMPGGQHINLRTRSCTDTEEVKEWASLHLLFLPSLHVAGVHWGKKCGFHWVYAFIQLWKTCLHHSEWLKKRFKLWFFIPNRLCLSAGLMWVKAQQKNFLLSLTKLDKHKVYDLFSGIILHFVSIIKQ